jgi:hypothetical protein
MGQDISAVHASYKLMVHSHFEALRAQRLRYLNGEWAPRYVAAWVEDGRLVDVANGKVVWSPEKGDFVAPDPATAQANLLQTIRFWAQAAINEIQTKSLALLSPLDMAEDSLTVAVDDAFNQLYRANSVITAHLNSLREVQEVQDDALAALRVKALRDKIDSAIVQASDKAQEALEAIRVADSLPAKAEGILRKNHD